MDFSKMTLGGQDIRSLVKGLAIALIGAALTYFTAYFTKANFGVYTPVVVVVWSTIANVVRKLLDGQVA